MQNKKISPAEIARCSSCGWDAPNCLFFAPLDEEGRAFMTKGGVVVVVVAASSSLIGKGGGELVHVSSLGPRSPFDASRVGSPVADVIDFDDRKRMR